MDDGLGASSTFDAAIKQSLSVGADLVASGFVPNCDKCQWSPTQQLICLGLDWDLLNEVLKIPARRVTRLLTEIEALADHTKCKATITARKLASVAGLIMTNSLVFGNICKLMTKAMYRQIESRQLWHSKLILDNHVQQELDFWRKEVNRLHFRFISADLPSPSRFVYSDASSTGCAAYIALDESPIFHKIWTDFEMKQSAAWRELQCINLALPSFKSLLASHTVKWFTDNQSVKSILESGSMKEHLHKIALDVYFFTKYHNTNLEVEWIPRAENEKADYLSKIIDPEDWGIKSAYFHAVSAHWGINFTIDCFANGANTKTPRFYSTFYQPDSLGVDAFSFEWYGEICWLAPPISLVDRAVQQVVASRCLAVLAVPVWPSAVFWPLLVTEFNTFRSFIVDYLYIENGKDVEHGMNTNFLFGPNNFTSVVAFFTARRVTFVKKK